ncbi:MAG: hypothetical protein ABI811_05515 [Acidobacteriota bacterium]
MSSFLLAAGVAALLVAGLVVAPQGLRGQGKGQAKGQAKGGGPQAPQTPRATAPVDLTGYWVSVVTEDWRYRMVTPTKGDFQGVPMSPEGRKIADTWDPATAASAGDVCRSYGAPASLRVPGRLHITWQDDQTLRLDTDAGKQTRLFHFGDWKAPAGPGTLQGDSTAEWLRGGGRGGAPTGWLKVNTANLKPGLLRKNGVPYSESTTVMDYFDVIKMPNGDPLLVVTTTTTDPKYLRQPFIITSHFKKEASDAKWHPTECSATW